MIPLFPNNKKIAFMKGITFTNEQRKINRHIWLNIKPLLAKRKYKLQSYIHETKKNKCQLLHISSPRIYGVMIWIFQMIKEDE